jgi:hypothetical protein
LRHRLKSGILNSWSEAVLWVVAMLVVDMARDAKIIVLARSAGNKVLFGKFYEQY